MNSEATIFLSMKVDEKDEGGYEPVMNEDEGSQGLRAMVYVVVISSIVNLF